MGVENSPGRELAWLESCEGQYLLYLIWSTVIGCIGHQALLKELLQANATVWQH
jgi:hypothetical protein